MRLLVTASGFRCCIANLAFEEIGLDLYVVLLLALLSIGAWWRYGRQPLFVYYTTAYGVGLVATAVAKLF